jgi:type VI secretion system protein ImpF
MKKADTIQASILDRLIDTQPDISVEPVQKRTLDFEQGKRAVLRDLANLLNTKSTAYEVPRAYRQVERSLFVYGLPDFTSLNPKNKKVRQQILEDLERAISLFEPRLQNAVVKIEQSTDKSNRSLKFKISGMLVLDPLSQPIQFDTYFDINKSQYVVSE